MLIDQAKIVATASRLKTPLSVTGIAIIGAYAVFQKLLSLNVFENIGAPSTFSLLKTIVNDVFVLALVSLVLGLLSYLLVALMPRKGAEVRPAVTLIDASLDPQHEGYIQTEVDRIKHIHPRKDI